MEPNGLDGWAEEQKYHTMSDTTCSSSGMRATSRPKTKQVDMREAILNRAISAAAVFPGSTTMQLHVLLLSIVPLALATSATIWLRAGMERECGRGGSGAYQLACPFEFCSRVSRSERGIDDSIL